MRPFPGVVLLGGLAVLLAADVPAQAAWNNVFQVSCFRNKRTTSSFFGRAACCEPAPVVANAAPCPPRCTTSYIQRSYYQPVTTYKQECHYEPVTTYKTSYYYEPVCSYRYSCYYDPCTCSYQQVATPVTSYRLRSRCDAVTSYMQRTQMVPVTSYQLSYYYQPVTTCCDTTVGAPIANIPQGAAPRVPGVGEDPGIGQGGNRPRVGEDPGASDSFRPRETNPPPLGGAYDSSYRQPRPRNTETEQPVLPSAAPKTPKVRIDRIVMLEDPNVEGQVVRADNRSPHSNVRLLFVNTDVDGEQLSVTADGQGRFQATLAKGSWLVYVRNAEGTPVFKQRISVGATDRTPILLTSR